MTNYVKDPDARLDYAQDWEKWLDGDTITASSWILSPDNADTDLVIDTSGFTTTKTTVWLSGGTLGVKYTVTNRVTTVAGRIDDRSDTFEIQHR